VNRRDFLSSSAGVATGLGLGAVSLGAQAPAGTAPAASRRQERTPPVSSLDFKTKPHKALIAEPTEDDLTRMKAAGFEGVEGRVIPVPQAAKMREVADKLGMRIHSVLYGWAEFNSPVPAEVQGDAARLRQLVSILVDNALRHAPSGSRVDVRVRTDAGNALLVVEDEGQGIRPEDLPRVFDRFYRAAGAPGGGTGLGLAIAAWIVERHGGRIAAANRDPRGARSKLSK